LVTQQSPFNLIRIKRIFQQELVHPWSYRIIRVALAALFIYSGVIKLFDSKTFAAVISAYDLVPEAFHPVVAVCFLCLNRLSDWSRLPTGAGVSERGVFIDMPKSIKKRNAGGIFRTSVKQKASFTLRLRRSEIFCFLKGNRIHDTSPGRDGQADRGILVIENTSEVIQVQGTTFPSRQEKSV